jgi:hypothetical protein
MPPPETGCMRASHLFAPNHGAVTRESATLRIGTAKDCSAGVGETGRYIIWSLDQLERATRVCGSEGTADILFDS